MNKLDLKSIEDNISRLKKVLHKNRVKILLILDERETCACEIIEKMRLPNNLVSHHLKTLSDLGILKGRKEGLHIKYSIRKERKKQVSRLLDYLSSYCENA